MQNFFGNCSRSITGNIQLLKLMSKKANVIEAKGKIYKESGNGYFNVELDEPEGHQCLCRASGRLITRSDRDWETVEYFR